MPSFGSKYNIAPNALYHRFNNIKLQSVCCTIGPTGPTGPVNNSIAGVSGSPGPSGLIGPEGKIV